LLEEQFTTLIPNGVMKSLCERFVQMQDSLSIRREVLGVRFANDKFLRYSDMTVKDYDGEFCLSTSKYEFKGIDYWYNDDFINKYLMLVSDFSDNRIACLAKMFSQIFSRDEKLFFNFCDVNGNGGKTFLIGVLSEIFGNIGNITASTQFKGQELLNYSVGVIDDIDINKNFSETLELIKNFANTDGGYSINAKYRGTQQVAVKTKSIVLIHNEPLYTSNIDQALLNRMWSINFNFDFSERDEIDDIIEYGRSKDMRESLLSFVAWCCVNRKLFKHLRNLDNEIGTEKAYGDDDLKVFCVENAKLDMPLQELYYMCIDEQLIHADDMSFKRFSGLTSKYGIFCGQRRRHLQGLNILGRIAYNCRHIIEVPSVKNKQSNDTKELDILELMKNKGVIQTVNKEYKYSIPKSQNVRCLEFIASVAKQLPKEASNITILNGTTLIYKGTHEAIIKNLESSPLKRE
jgi:hypothetical protein